MKMEAECSSRMLKITERPQHRRQHSEKTKKLQGPDSTHVSMFMFVDTIGDTW
jgi:hypothetical protein